MLRRSARDDRIYRFVCSMGIDEGENAVKTGDAARSARL
jgi:hypothetical protein